MLHIADKTFDSHLFTGTGKFASSQLMVESIRASGSQLVTLAMKRATCASTTTLSSNRLRGGSWPCCRIVPGAKTAEEAIFAAHLAREALGTNWLKLEIHPDARWLLPDPIETLKPPKRWYNRDLSCCLTAGPIRYCVNVWKKSAVQR